MAFRGNESGMDFEYQNRTGPMDMRSPFAQLSQNSQQFAAPQTPSRNREPLHPRLPSGSTQTNGRTTGNVSAWDSPTKGAASNRQSPDKPLPPRPETNPWFTTPRKMNNEMDDSSAGDTPQSPERQVDSDATPDNVTLRNMGRPKLEATTAPAQSRTSPERQRRSPTKEKERPPPSARRDSWLVRIKKSFSPGRGEIARPEHHDKTKDGRVRKQKRRRQDELRKEVGRRRRDSISSSGDDDYLATKKSQHRADASPSGPQESSISQLFTFISRHPAVPHILSWYAQLAFNVFLLAGCAYVIYSFWAAVQQEVDEEARTRMGEIMGEMAICAKDFTDNRCEPASSRPPALETLCENWAKCMRQDPMRVGRARVSAQTFAKIFNSFVGEISWKAMIFTLLVVFVAFAATNLAFGLFRKEVNHHAVPSYAPPQYYAPPTPQRSFSGQDGGAGFYGTPWHQPPMALEPQPSGGGFGQIEGWSSPVRRLQYR